jgi:beta-lactamase class A
MRKHIQLIALILLFGSESVYSQTTEVLRQRIQQIIQSKDAVVGISIAGMNGDDTLTFNGEKHVPMQSVFKLPIALAMLSEIDKGRFSLDQPIKIKKEELLPGLWSPIREKYPEGATLTIAEILEYTVSLSDNAGCDILLKLLEKPEVVEHYFTDLGFKDISIKINEETMQGNWDSQFRNWITPKESHRILQAFFENKNNLLSQKSYDFIWNILKSTQTGQLRLRGQLPQETVVAHKTGTSGEHKKTGVTAAVNDIGVVFLPNGDFFYISVFVTDSKENFETIEKIISDVAKASWDYFLSKQ